MNRIVYAILALAALTSCANSYNIQGTSNVSMLDGRMLYLKVYQQDNMKNVDSCDVVHGQFHFTGTVDTTRMAILFMDDESIMPMVIEGGDITVRLDNMQQKVSGTPLNDKLTQFNDDYNKLQSRLNDLGHKQTQAIMNGDDEMETNRKLAAEADEIAQEEDKLVTSFITENFDNVLGPGVFFMITAGYFKNDAYVKSFYEKARQNEAIMNGTAEAPLPQPSTLPQVPTPNEMAAPADTLR